MDAPSEMWNFSNNGNSHKCQIPCIHLFFSDQFQGSSKMLMETEEVRQNISKLNKEVGPCRTQYGSKAVKYCFFNNMNFIGTQRMLLKRTNHWRSSLSIFLPGVPLEPGSIQSGQEDTWYNSLCASSSDRAALWPTHIFIFLWHTSSP